MVFGVFDFVVHHKIQNFFATSFFSEDYYQMVFELKVDQPCLLKVKAETSVSADFDSGEYDLEDALLDLDINLFDAENDTVLF